MKDRPCLRTFEFRESRMYIPSANLETAIALIQTHILASDTCLEETVMFPRGHDARAVLETALTLLVPLAPVLNDAEWEDEP